MKKTNMTLIAARAGISQKTVSRVLNNEKYVKEETREKVLKIVQELNYKPNYFASTLKKGKTNLVGISVSGRSTLLFTNPYAAKIFNGIGRVLTARKYKLIFHILHPTEHSMDQSHELVEGRVVDGMVYVLGSEFYQDFLKNTLPYLNELGTPFVVIHSLKDPLDCPNVGLDSVRAGYIATRHLTDAGYDTIGCVHRPAEVLHSEEMYQGYLRALREAGRVLDRQFDFEEPCHEHDEGYAFADRLLKEKTRLPRALFVTSDLAAAGMIKRFGEAGIKVPDDLAMVGFGNDEDPFYCPLTTVVQPAMGKGMKAAEYLVDAIENPDKADKKWFYCFEPELIIRQTT